MQVCVFFLESKAAVLNEYNLIQHNLGYLLMYAAIMQPHTINSQ